MQQLENKKTSCQYFAYTRQYIPMKKSVPTCWWVYITSYKNALTTETLKKQSTCAIIDTCD